MIEFSKNNPVRHFDELLILSSKGLCLGQRRDRRRKKEKIKMVWRQLKILSQKKRVLGLGRSLLPYVLKQGLFFLSVVVGQRCCLRWTRSRTSKLSLGWFPLLSNWHKTACYAPIPLLYWIPMWLCGCPDTHERTSMTEKRAKHSACRYLSPQYLVFMYLWCLCRRFSRLEVNKHLLKTTVKENLFHYIGNQLSYTWISITQLLEID